MKSPELIVLFEHPRWQKPLFETLDKRGVGFKAYDVTKGAFGDHDLPASSLYFNQASPSAYLRGHERAVPFVLELMEELESRGARVLNGSRAFRLEISKLAQVRLLRNLGVSYPRTWAFNDVAALELRQDELAFPAVVKPNQGGSGARMFRVDSLQELKGRLSLQRELWLPDNLLLLQEYVEHDQQGFGIVRMEFVGGEFLYALRVVSRGQFNLCPSEICNPGEPSAGSVSSFGEAPEFVHFKQVPEDAVETGKKIVRAAGLDIGAVEYLESVVDGRRVFYDINANSNLRRSLSPEFGFDPFDRVADFLQEEIKKVPLHEQGPHDNWLQRTVRCAASR